MIADQNQLSHVRGMGVKMFEKRDVTDFANNEKIKCRKGEKLETSL